MANLFDGANKIKNEVEELEKTLENLKLTSARLETIGKTISEIENISPDLQKIAQDISNLQENYKNLDIETLKSSISTHIDELFEKKKIWLLYIPLVVGFIGFIVAVSVTIYIYFESIRTLKSQNENLVNRLDSIYNMHLLDEKFWYNKKNQKLFLSDYDWIEKQMKEEKNQK